MSVNDIILCGTYSRGLKDFVECYLTESAPLELIDHTFEGRAYFHYPTFRDLTSLKALKYFERLFLNVHYESICHKVWTKSEYLNLVKKTFIRKLDDLKRLIFVLLSLKSKSISDNDNTGFRISCKISGRMKNRIDSKRLSQELSILIRKSMRLIVNLKRPDVEISLKLNDEGYFVGLPIFDQPISIRSYLDPEGLRSPICDAMVSLLDRASRFVLDPFCGTGNLIREAANQLDAPVIGMDCNLSSVERSKQYSSIGRCNTEYARFLFYKVLPFRNSQFDAILTDLPFGQKFICKTSDNSDLEVDITLFYERVCQESLRLLALGGRAIYLTSNNLRQCLTISAEKAYDSEKKFELSKQYNISLGTNEACIISFVVICK